MVCVLVRPWLGVREQIAHVLGLEVEVEVDRAPVLDLGEAAEQRVAVLELHPGEGEGRVLQVGLAGVEVAEGAADGIDHRDEHLVDVPEVVRERAHLVLAKLLAHLQALLVHPSNHALVDEERLDLPLVCLERAEADHLTKERVASGRAGSGSGDAESVQQG